jgi:rhodanese-related sulfurtransferase
MLALAYLYWFLGSLLSGKKLSPQLLGSFVKSHNARLIDLRDSSDFKAGHITGSENIPFSQLASHIATLKDSTTPVVFICKMGQTAGSAAAQLQSAQAYKLDGGIYNWQAAGLPTVKGK